MAAAGGGAGVVKTKLSGLTVSAREPVTVPCIADAVIVSVYVTVLAAVAVTLTVVCPLAFVGAGVLRVFPC